MSDFSITEYLSDGVENIVKNAVKASFSNPAESIFMANYEKIISSMEKKYINEGR